MKLWMTILETSKLVGKDFNRELRNGNVKIDGKLVGSFEEEVYAGSTIEIGRRKFIMNQDGYAIEVKREDSKAKYTKNDLTGRRFGKLVVIKETELRKRRCICWLCKCDCGNEKTVSSDYLIKGHTHSCGCLRVDRAKQMVRYNIKNSGCMECGSDKHYAKGLCRSCYEKKKRNIKKGNL